MDSFEVDYDALRTAQDDLARLRAQLADQLGAAQQLINSVPGSTAPIHDPVADKMHEVYLGRADQEGGVHGVLEEYLEELDDVQLIIDTTLRTYFDADADAARGMRGAGGEVH